MQQFGIIAFDLQVTSAVRCGGDTDRRRVPTGAIWCHVQLQFSGLDVDHRVLIGQLPGLAIARPSAADEPNAAFCCLSTGAIDP